MAQTETASVSTLHDAICQAQQEFNFYEKVSDDSMYPNYQRGDILACLNIPINVRTFIQWGKVYVLNTTQGIMIKRIKKGKQPNTLSLVSDNPEFNSFEFPINQIYSIANIVCLIRPE